MAGIEEAVKGKGVVIYSRGISAWAPYVYAEMLRKEGYVPQIVQNPIQLKEKVEELDPLAVLIDLDFDDRGNEAYTKEVNASKLLRGSPSQLTLEQETFEHMLEQIDIIHELATTPVLALTHSKNYRKNDVLQHKIGEENILGKEYLKDALACALQRLSPEKRVQVAVYVNGLKPLFEELLGNHGIDVMYTEEVDHITRLIAEGHPVDLVIADLDLADKRHVDLASNLGWTGIPMIVTYQGSLPSRLRELGLTEGEKETLKNLGVHPIERNVIGSELYPMIDRLIGKRLEPRMD